LVCKCCRTIVIVRRAPPGSRETCFLQEATTQPRLRRHPKPSLHAHIIPTTQQTPPQQTVAAAAPYSLTILLGGYGDAPSATSFFFKPLYLHSPARHGNPALARQAARFEVHDRHVELGRQAPNTKKKATARKFGGSLPRGRKGAFL